MQQALCATYPIPLASPDSYTGEAWVDFIDNIDCENCQPEHLPAMIKWYNSDEDSYSSCCPKDKKYSYKRTPTIQLEWKYIQHFEGDQKGVTYWTIIKIQVDLQEEYKILDHASTAANLKRKAKESQQCFIQWDIE